MKRREANDRWLTSKSCFNLCCVLLLYLCMNQWECMHLIVLLHHARCCWWLDGAAVSTGAGWLLQMILCVAATATQLELLSPLILGLHVMWKTPWVGSTSSSDDRSFTCQFLFIIPLRFVVYSTEFNFSYVKYFPVFCLCWKKNMRIRCCFAVSESNQPQVQLDLD